MACEVIGLWSACSQDQAGVLCHNKGRREAVPREGGGRGGGQGGGERGGGEGGERSDRGEGGVRLWAETIGGGLVLPLLQKQLEGEKEQGRREKLWRGSKEEERRKSQRV